MMKRKRCADLVVRYVCHIVLILVVVLLIFYTFSQDGEGEDEIKACVFNLTFNNCSHSLNKTEDEFKNAHGIHTRIGVFAIVTLSLILGVPCVLVTVLKCCLIWGPCARSRTHRQKRENFTSNSQEGAQVERVILIT
uniref:Uncharacterized protein n=1 Tax=Aplanochytrium stocchinoi TaxID=215587 RepID=A0A7S3PIQ3_9STRA